MEFHSSSYSGFGAPETRLTRKGTDVVVEMSGEIQRKWAIEAAAVLHCEKYASIMTDWCRAMRIPVPPMNHLSAEESDEALNRICLKYWDAVIAIESIKNGLGT